MASFEELEKRIEQIEARNKRVTEDKAWEGSATRKILLIIFTYLSIALYLRFVIHIDPWLNAIVPALGFLLSTLSLPYFRQIWHKHIYKK
jgi:uncharacterized protein (DUF983 family)